MIPLYFLPKVMLAGFAPGGVVNRSLVASRGLVESLADAEGIDDLCHAEVCGKGPSGDPGLIVGALPIAGREPPRRLGYFADEQIWTKIDENLWIGVDRAFPPLPAELARKDFFRGYKIKLGDGNEWEIPVIRDFGTHAPRLPRDMFYDEHGIFTTRLREEYAAIWEKTERAARLFYDAKSVEFGAIGLESALDIGLTALALNYRVGKPEQRILRLLTTTNWEEALGAMVDWPLFEDYLRREMEASKKNSAPPTASASASLTPGEKDSAPATGRATENCNS
jgi:hypothetical protein